MLPDAIERAVRLPCCVLWPDKDGDNLGGTGVTANKLGVGMVPTGNTVPLEEEITNGKVSGNRSVKVVDVEQTPTAGLPASSGGRHLWTAGATLPCVTERVDDTRGGRHAVAHAEQ
ncbi:hypothetical protein ACFV3E_41105 [Streptomyces sp. NPDC059718]